MRKNYDYTVNIKFNKLDQNFDVIKKAKIFYKNIKCLTIRKKLKWKINEGMDN